jgi:hypothetical protein
VKPVQGLTLKYPLHFIIFFGFTAFLVVGFIYPMIAEWSPAWRILGRPWWFAIPIEVLACSYASWMTLITSYELTVEDDWLIANRPWGHSRKYRFPEITRLSKITRGTSLIRTNQGDWIPLSGLTSVGVKRKLEFEKILTEKLSRQNQ